MKKKTLTIAIALVLVVALAVGATYAYLTATTKAVTNTFTAGGAVAANDLTLKEHKVIPNTDGSYTLDNTTYLDEGEGNSYVVLPGVNLPKDPTVEVKKADGPYYLFVEVTKGDQVGNNDTTKALSYTVDGSHWVALKIEGKEVYAYSTDGKNPAILSKELTPTQILAPTADETDATDNTITVSGDEALTSALTPETAKLTFTAYACQAAGFADATAAFNACFGTANP